MDEEKLISRGSLIVGTLLVSTGCTLAAYYGFRERFVPVYIAFTLFAAGYKVSWYGTREFHNFESIIATIKNIPDKGPQHVSEELENYILLAAGLASISYGFIVFTQNILNFSVESAVIAGFATFAGYMVAHEGVNEVLI